MHFPIVQGVMKGKGQSPSVLAIGITRTTLYPQNGTVASCGHPNSVNFRSERHKRNARNENHYVDFY